MRSRQRFAHTTQERALALLRRAWGRRVGVLQCTHSCVPKKGSPHASRLTPHASRLSLRNGDRKGGHKRRHLKRRRHTHFEMERCRRIEWHLRRYRINELAQTRQKNRTFEHLTTLGFEENAFVLTSRSTAQILPNDHRSLSRIEDPALPITCVKRKLQVRRRKRLHVLHRSTADTCRQGTRYGSIHLQRMARRVKLILKAAEGALDRWTQRYQSSLCRFPFRCASTL